MENSQTLATDSFSYSWLINRKPSIDNIKGLVESHRPSLDDDGSAVLEDTVREEVMHAVVLQQHYSSCPSNNFCLKKEAEEEDFDFKIGGADHLIPADEIFSGGCIKPVPVYHDASTSSSSTRVQLVSSSSSSSTPIFSSLSCPPSPPRNITTTNRRSGRRRNEYYLILMMRKWSKSSLHKCFAFLSRIKFGWCSRKSVRVVDFLDRNACEVGIISSSSSWSDSLLVLNRVPSPPVPPFSPAGCRSCDVETSIHEAILHCKRSFGQ